MGCRVIVSFTLLLNMAAVGCGTRPPGTLPPGPVRFCQSDSQCGRGEICDDGICLYPGPPKSTLHPDAATADEDGGLEADGGGEDASTGGTPDGGPAPDDGGGVADAGGAPGDGGAIEDAGRLEADGGAGLTDGGPAEVDAGELRVDAGQPEPDAGAPIDDAGAPTNDAGGPLPDGGDSPDAGGPGIDAGGLADGGSPASDGGPVPEDAGAKDGGTPVSDGGPIGDDAGPTPVDAGPPDLDAGLPKLDAGPPDAGHPDRDAGWQVPDCPRKELSNGMCAACSQNGACPSGLNCVVMERSGESFCTKPCWTGFDCPSGWVCNGLQVAIPNGQFCIPDNRTCIQGPCGACQCPPNLPYCDLVSGYCYVTEGRRLCATCDVSFQCGLYHDRCVNEAGTFDLNPRWRCGLGCNSNTDCPQGYSCQAMWTKTGEQIKQCKANSGYCERTLHCSACVSDDEACGGGHCLDVGGNASCVAHCNHGFDCPPATSCRETSDFGEVCWPNNNRCP